mmetsp:Transcript_453/g.1372  ORF Transcript_453/g.1372 Transcript_453/m.1372 type:complete len:116 (-) Transcript_453:523-870(-)
MATAKPVHHFLALIVALALLSSAHGFSPLPVLPPDAARTGVVGSAGITEATTTAPTASAPRSSGTVLYMAEESEESKERRRRQQIGAAAVFLFGALYDFFVTHHGVGFWDPNYVP